MNERELQDLFSGYGYAPKTVSLSERIDEDMHRAVFTAFQDIRALQERARRGEVIEVIERLRWPMLIVRTPKGWTGLAASHRRYVYRRDVRAHQVPAKAAKAIRRICGLSKSGSGPTSRGNCFDHEGSSMPDIRES